MANAGFENAIKNYLDKRAESDRLFAESYRKENKSIQECCKYIYSQARKIAKGGNAVGVDDDTVFGWAVHYYDEDNIKAENEINACVVIPGKYAAKEAIKPTSKQQKTVKQKVIKKNSFDDRQLSLFSF